MTPETLLAQLDLLKQQIDEINASIRKELSETRALLEILEKNRVERILVK